jgi:hypothetical protein
MKSIKQILVFAFLFNSIIIFAQFTDVINSNRPGESMGAFSVGKNVIQAEAGVKAFKADHKVLNYDDRGFTFDIAARGGLLFEELELIVETQFQFDQYTSGGLQTNRNGLGNTTFGAKYLFYDPYKERPEKPNIYSWKANHKFNWKKFIPALSGYVGANYTANNNYKIPGESSLSPKVILIAQNQFDGALVLVTNIIADKIGSKNSSFGYIITLTKGFNEKWAGFIEQKGIKGDYYSDGIATLGATYLLDKDMQIDASISKNFKNSPDLIYGGIGFSWRFDKKHKDQEINTDGKGEPAKLKKAQKIEEIKNDSTPKQ